MASRSSRQKSVGSKPGSRALFARLLRQGERFENPGVDILEAAAELQALGMVRLRQAQAVYCANPDDRDFPPRDPDCPGIIELHEGADEGGGDYVCPICDRIVHPIVDDLYLNVCGTIQPKTAVAVFGAGSADGSADDGFLDRFGLIAYPEPVAWQLVDRWPDSAKRRALREACERLAGTNWHTLLRKERDDDTPHARFAPEGPLMHCCLTGFLPGFSGCYPGETPKALSPETQSLTTSGGGCSGSSGFSGSSGGIKECGSELFYYHWLYGRYLATRVRPPLYPIISLVAHPEEPEKPEQPRYPEQGPRLSWPERELVRQLGAKLDSKRPDGGR